MQANSLPNSGLALVDTLLSYGSITLFALSAILAIRDLRRTLQGRLLIALLISLMFLAVSTAPDAHSLPMSLFTFSMAVGLPNLGLLWWFCLSLLRDDFRIGTLEWAGLIVLVCVPFAYFVELLGINLPFIAGVNALGNFPPIAMVGHVVWVAIAERKSDLVEPRRLARIWLAFAPLLALLVSLITESMDSEQLASIWRNGVGIIPAQLVIFFWLTRMNPESLQFRPLATAIPFPPRIDPKDIALHRRLMQAMDDERFYLHHGLTIEGLAERVKVPTHQLRHLINAGLGYRNFASFLNGYRLKHAKSALADVDRARVTVLAIAYESGFASLQSFNRVFKDVEGQTPTDFRAAKLALLVQN